MDMIKKFEDFFLKASGFPPYPYQKRWALESDQPSLVSIPTGLGKTAGAILNWIWRRRYADAAVREKTPRRLVYCLPMRVLVEQTVKNAGDWLNNLGLYTPPDAGETNGIRLYPLLGGEVDNDWDRFPDRETILVGTQDMLLSRALNRGYAMSRFRWPMQFGLLNNDCLWVLDEVQLMGSGLSTSTQLQAFRRILGTACPVRSVWMSATIRKDWLRTVDFDGEMDGPGLLELNQEDLRCPDVIQRVQAGKPVRKVDVGEAKDTKATARLIFREHRSGTLTLVVVNTIKRAMALYDDLRKQAKDSAELLLLHSRFRLPDRKKIMDRILTPVPDAGRIAVTTQVIEAGVDLSAGTLLTDLAPWPSMIQRFGRCNRRGEDAQARVLWLDLDTSKKGAAKPYEPEELEESRVLLEGLENARPVGLPAVDKLGGAGLVIRRRDLLDLFDTTPDLAGADIDVSRFIRDTDDHDVRVFWRDWEGDKPSPDESRPMSDELCPVPIHKIKEFRDVGLWRWDHQEKEWVRPQTIFPGLVLMLNKKAGGYNSEYGWTGDKKDVPEIVAVVVKPDSSPESIGDDPTTRRSWQTLADHLDAAVREVRSLIEGLPVANSVFTENLLTAARWHDAGKPHFVFQNALTGGKTDGQIWAKAPSMAARYERTGFRHELASALAMIQLGLPDLAAYLTAAHHGKVRLSIRSMPNESPPPDPDRRFARGIWDGDQLGPADLGGGEQLPLMLLDLSLMEMGEGPLGDSWLARMLTLRDGPEIGPFRLGFLEAILRIADWRASAAKGGEHD